ncbi:Delta(12)-fatty-acid desaturase [Shimia sp. SK013]|uniref:fatty acid desaturase n=1 Tax=Shimia sp. SK013 TaxID=1389006 RepID=UPI0006CD7204|nr:fatty acid desaturase [Shimia sp. SK013]KPA22756.1 Delta(12)-fatty-acid desaturase [Shimia sp. SK013]
MTAPLDHKQALAQLAPDHRATLQFRSDAKGLRHLSLYLGALLCCALWVGLRLPYWALVLLPLGILWAFLFTLSHECTHDTPFATRWLNRLIGHACALPLLLPFTWFRAFHMAHHKFTNDPENDPELADGPRPDTWRAYIIYLSGWGYWRGMAMGLVKNAFGPLNAAYVPQRQHIKIRSEARVLLALYALVLLSLLVSPLIFWVWILPSLIGQPFLRAYLLAEHGHCPPVANMLENSRTTFTNRMVQFLAWNMPYHAEHHAFPNVPFHQLPNLHRALKPHLQNTSDGYSDFHRKYRSDLR